MNNREKYLSVTDGIEFCAKGWMEPVKVSDDDVPKSPELPYLDLFLDTVYMIEIFQTEKLFGSDFEYKIQSCQILYARYKPSRYCHIFYQLSLVNAVGDKLSSVMIAGKVINKLLAGKLESNDVVLRLGGQESAAMQYSFFPEDAKIKSLVLLSDRSALERQLRKTLNDPYIEIIRLDDNGYWVKILSYRPERYCLFQISIVDGNGNTKHIIARIFHSRKQSDCNWMLSQSLCTLTGPTQQNRIMIARPLGYAADRHMILSEKIEGFPLTRYLDQSRTKTAIITAANSLACIHNHPLTNGLETLEHKSPSDLIKDCQSILSSTRSISGIDHNSLSTVFERLRSTQPVDDDCTVLLHGDFSTNQILVNNDQACIIDFSGVRGDPYIDIGYFFARIHRHIPSSHHDETRDTFLECYQSQTGREIDRVRLAWFEAVTMLKDSYIGLKKLRKNWLPLLNNKANETVNALGYHEAARSIRIAVFHGIIGFSRTT